MPQPNEVIDKSAKSVAALRKRIMKQVAVGR
jgi:hypothetical protein